MVPVLPFRRAHSRGYAQLPGLVPRAEHGDVIAELEGQVRQPIFRRGSELWHHVGRWLDPLTEALGRGLPDREAA